MPHLALLLLAPLFQSVSAIQPGPGGQGGLPHRTKTPSGLTVFLADRVTDGAFELWASRLDGSAPWRVSGALPVGGSLSSFWLAPDGEHVAYLGTQVAVGDFGLFVAPIDGSSFVRASQPGDSLQLTAQNQPWSPDGEWLTYTVSSGGSTQLWSVRPDGTQRSELSDILVPGGDVVAFGWSPDSARVAFIADRLVLGRRDLYTATPDGQQLDLVHPVTASPSKDVSQFVWSPAGAQIAFVGDLLTDGEPELFVAAPTGVGFHSVTVGNALPGAFKSQVEWTPDGSRLVLVSAAAVANRIELWIVNASGAGWTRLNGPLIPGGNVSEFRLAPDGSRVAYRADQTLDNRPELYTTLLDGTGNVPISGPFTNGGDVALPGVFSWSPNSQHVAYLADQQTVNRIEVFVAQPDGSGNLKVSGGLFPTANHEFGTTSAWSSDSERLAYVANSFGLHPITVRPDGSGAVVVTGPIVAGGGASYPIWSGDASRVVYRASQFAPGVNELFASDPDGADNQLLSGVTIPAGDVTTVVVK